MKIKIHLNNGMEFVATVTGYNGADFTAQLNNSQISHVNIGDLVLSKHSVMMIMPFEDVPEVL